MKMAAVAINRAFAPTLQDIHKSMDKLVIHRGGNPLLGTVRISGAKNAALPAMAAALLTEEPVILENIPQVRDIETERRLLAGMGAEVELGYGRAHHRTTICCRNLGNSEASYDLVKTMRASTLVSARWWRVPDRPACRCLGLRHRGASHRPAPEGTGAAGSGDFAGAWLHRGPLPAASRCPHCLRQDHSHRYRRSADGRHLGRR